LLIDNLKKMKGEEILQGAKIDNLKRMIRKDYTNWRNLQDDGYDSFEAKWIKGPSTKEEKLYYGSDSDMDVRSVGEADFDIDYDQNNPEEVALY